MKTQTYIHTWVLVSKLRVKTALLSVSTLKPTGKITTNAYALFLRSDQLPVQLELENQFGILAFCWFKQAVALVSRVSSTCSFGSLLRFPRGFHALLWETLLVRVAVA